MHLKIITQIQITPISITTENNTIKTFCKVLQLSILSLLFIIISLITLVHFSTSLPTNLFLHTQNFYDLNIDLVYATYHIDIRKYSDSTYTF